MAAKTQRAAHATKSSKPARERSFDDLPDLDRIIHERLRLGIVSALAINDSLSFNDLRRLLKTTDGNLSVHARKPEEEDPRSCAPDRHRLALGPNTERSRNHQRSAPPPHISE